ncbi:antibiotic biosynthesis monooxygenase [Candidatus Dojkabacteria bacterium]|nr:antibiotic biosynthesis monooxygenase [Candidatus Dojkabacteria bacterium]
MISYLFEYKVKPGMLDQGKQLVVDFIDRIQNEEGILLYSPFLYKEGGGKFIHVITFENEAAKNRYFDAEYTKTFIEEITKISINETKFTEVEYIKEDGD